MQRLRITLPSPSRIPPASFCGLLRLCTLVFFFALIPSSVAQQPPNPPAESSTATAPPSGQATPGTVSGFITDRDGAAIPGARITLTRIPQTTQSESNLGAHPAGPTFSAVSAAGGRFSFPDLPPGPFTLSITASGFAPREIPGELQPGEIREFAPISLLAATSTDIQITANQVDIAEAQINLEEKQRVLDFIPNFYVSYIPNPVPLDPKQKFELAWKTLIDPVSLILNGVTAGAQQADNTYSWGQGAQGYGKRYAAAYGTFMSGTLIGSAILPILFKQDPRYFYKGIGTIHSRAGYAIANAVICKGDNHRWQPNYSAILGGIAAGGISNAYYPAVNRTGAGLTFEGAAIGTGISAVSNLLQEFLIRKLTPHAPKNLPVANP